ncbi:MAG TPA: ferritin-like domain-containing protein [Gemmatimonadales bacterium]|nr:ferritin-like domain-containing protein [Gemmatimonadales bacterium]
MSLDSLHDLYVDELKDLHSAERQLLRALPRMAKAAESPELRTAFEKHLKETEKQLERLDRIFSDLGKKGTGKKCVGMEGLVEEGKEMMEEEADPAVMDAALIAAAQRVEHYEIAGYGCVRNYAELLGYSEAARLLQASLEEEEAADRKLSELAESGINNAAMAVAGAED